MIVPQKHHPSHRVRRRIGWGLLAVLTVVCVVMLVKAIKKKKAANA